MDHVHYSKLWLDARKDLEKLIKDDQIIKNGPQIEDRDSAEFQILKLYFRYRKIVQRLTICHDQIIQPQIREFIGKMLDYTIVRMLEIRQEMVNYSFIDYPWPLEALFHLRWTFDDIDISAPVYDASKRQAEFERRNILFENFLKSTKHFDGSDSGSEATSFQSDLNETEEVQSTLQEEEKEKSEVMSTVVIVKQRPEIDMQEAERKAFNDAVLLIQSNERARVGRRIATNVVRQLLLRKRLGSQQLSPKKVNREKETKAAIIIQKTWRGFSTRRRLEKKKRKIEELLYMTIPSGGTHNILKVLQAASKQKSDLQASAVRKLEEFIELEEKRIWETRGPGLIEDIRDEIRAWFFEWLQKMGFFDYIPPVECGGSVLIATGQSRTPDEYFASLSEGKNKKKEKPQEAEDDTEESKGESEGWSMQESRVIPFLIELNDEYLKKWNCQMIKILDPTGPLIEEFIYENICNKLQLEMREIADESMRQELEKLNAALMLDHADTEFALPKPQECEAIVEEEKPGTELLPGVSEDDLLIELMRSKVIRDCPECHLSDWPGVPSYALRGNDEIRLGDIKQAVMDYCVLPIVSKEVHKFAPLVRSVCICGPPGSGQLFIARAVCTELKATVFDLTPEKHMGRFKAKASQNRLAEAVLRLARAYAPSVVLVEGDKAWLKKVPIEMRRMDPKRFSPVYKKIISSIEPGDQVLFLTTSTQPYLADKSFLKLHDKFIIIPVADYGTTFLAYKKSLMSHHAIPRHFEVSSLARVIAKETPIEFAQNALDECLKIKRRMDFKRRPLRPMEILEQLQNDEDKPTKKDLELFEKFRSQVPLEKKRRELIEELEKLELEKEKK